MKYYVFRVQNKFLFHNKCFTFQSPKTKTWANENYLSLRALRHAASVRDQLWRILQEKKQDHDGTSCQQPSSCSPDYEPFLRCLVSAFHLNIARKDDGGESLRSSVSTYKGRDQKTTGVNSTSAPYKTIRGGRDVYLHPSSMLGALIGRNKLPDHVVFAELLVTTKSYIHNVTAIDGSWLTEIHPNLYKTKFIASDG